MARGGSEEHERWREWMRAAQAGESEPYRLLLEELYDFCEAYVRRIVGDHPLAEDCVQECMTAIHRARHSYDPGRPIRPWLGTVVRHKVIDVLRRDRSSALTEQDESDLRPAPGPSPAGQVEGAVDADRLLQRLDAPYREALVLTKLRGESVADAAAQAGVGLSAMKSRVSRGLRQLARLLEEEG